MAMLSIRQYWQNWWSALQQWVAGRSRAAPKVENESGATSQTPPPAAALLIQLDSRPRRHSDTSSHCATKVSARAWQSTPRVLDLLAYHAARHAIDVTAAQMQQRLNHIRAHAPD